ncbi:MAG: hypothetical protein IKM54_06590 [Butyricicoccus sp.]|nr:hypothetical protein [Butyricicoccus sp.]
MKVLTKYLSIVLFAVFLGGFLLAHLVLPDREFSPLENRSLAQKPAFSVEGLLDGSFTADLETYIADQFPLRDELMSLKATCERLWGRKENNGVYLGDDRLLEQVEEIDQAQLSTNLGALNRLKLSTDAPIWLMPVPTAAWLHADELPAGAPTADQDDLMGQLRGGSLNGVVDLRSVFEAHRDEGLFYRTDHHWTSRGAYYGAAAFLERLGREVPALGEPTVLSEDFNGTLFSSSGYRHITPDVMESYIAGAGVTVETWRNGSPETIGLIDESYLTEKDKYSAYLGGNTPLSIVRTGVADGGKLLIVRDSYADCFVPFLTESYSEIHLYDARYYKQPLSQYIAENAIDEVLVLYSLPDLCTDVNLPVVCK